MKKRLIILGLIAVAFFITNPNLDDFKTFAKEEYGDKVKEKLFEEPMKAVGLGIAHLFGELKVCRKNYYLFSVYFIKIKMLGKTEIRPVAIGFGTIFIKKKSGFENPGELDECIDAVEMIEII